MYAVIIRYKYSYASQYNKYFEPRQHSSRHEGRDKKSHVHTNIEKKKKRKADKRYSNINMEALENSNEDDAHVNCPTPMLVIYSLATSASDLLLFSESQQFTEKYNHIYYVIHILS